jgi:uncharacterized protein YkwD
MSPSLNLRRVSMCPAAAAAFAAPAAPASAAALPCVDGVPGPAATAPKCANADLAPASGNLRAVRRATLCLLNRERTSRGLGKLRANRPLRGVATKYARKMVGQAFFDPVSPAGSTFVDRIKRSADIDAGDGSGATYVNELGTRS